MAAGTTRGVIDVAFTPGELGRTRLEGVTAVVVDVVRASTTIVTALARGAAAVVPVATPDEARAWAESRPAAETLVGGERGGAALPGFDCGNSPSEYTAERVEGRTVVFTTTNGTRALLAVAAARRVAVGGYANASAVVRWAGRQPGDVIFVCSGEVGRFCLEDAACAGFLVDRLRRCRAGEAVTDAARAATLLSAHYAGDLGRLLAEATWAQALVAQGRGSDLPLCAAIDAFDVVPVVRDGRLVRAPSD